MESRLAWQPNKTANLPTLRHASYASPLNRNPSLGLQVSSSPRFRLKITCQPFSWIPVGRGRLLKAARFRNLRHIILNASAHRNEDLISGADHGETPRGKLNVDRVLIVGEGVCIAVATAACIAALTSRGSQDSRLVASSTTEPLMPRSTSLPIWQSFFLLAALIINAILRARQLQGRKHFRSTANKLAGADSSVEERVRKLEEEVASAVTIIRVLSKQLEKLGVRFRVTRQTLRDPIQETALLAQKTSESVNILAAREDSFEKGLEEIQHVLLGMQENQTKQLELISALGKLVKERTRNRVEKPTKGVRKDFIGVGLKQDGRDKGSDRDNALQNRFTQKLGSFIHRRTGIAQLPEIQRIEHITNSDRSSAQQQGLQSKEFSGTAPSPLIDHEKNLFKVNNLASERVDYWLNTPAPSSSKYKVEESVCDSAACDQLSSGGRSRSTFLDPTAEKSIFHNDSKELQGGNVQKSISKHEHTGAEDS